MNTTTLDDRLPATSARIRSIVRQVIRNGRQWQAGDYGYDDHSPQLPPAPPPNDLEVCLAAAPAAFDPIHQCSRHVGHTRSARLLRHAAGPRRVEPQHPLRPGPPAGQQPTACRLDPGNP